MALSMPSSPSIPGSRKMSAVSADWGFEDDEEQRELTDELDALSSTRAGRRRPGLSPVMIRRIQIGLACCISIGSHFGAYLLGPIKTSLHQSESSFASLISSFQLVNTVTPLLAGYFVPKFGAARVGLAATASVVVGLGTVVYAQKDGNDRVGLMVAGLLVYGLGLAPIAVVQESIILSKNSSKSKTIARSIALGLLFGKSSSGAAAWSAEPLAAISPRLPFITATLLGLFSFACCAGYSFLDRNYPEAEPEEKEQHHRIDLGEAAEFGDRFWVYILVCVFSALFYTTIHLSSSFLQAEYGVSEAAAAGPASLILFSSTLAYPLIGWAEDSRPSILRSFFLALPLGSAATYITLLWLTPVVPYWASTIPAALAIGGGPLCLVIVVPRIVERHQAPTALGLHKAAEMSSAVLLQSVCAWLLGGDEKAATLYRAVLKLLLFLTCLHSAVIFRWWRIIQRRALEEEEEQAEYNLLVSGQDDQDGWLRDDDDDEEQKLRVASPKGSRSPAESSRGWYALRATGGLVLASWLSFAVTLLR